MYLKMFFLKHLDQVTRHLEFKFQAGPFGSAGTFHFAEKWMVSMVTHLIGGLLLKYGLLFVKNSVGAFGKILGRRFTKTCFFDVWKMEN